MWSPNQTAGQPKGSAGRLLVSCSLEDEYLVLVVAAVAHPGYPGMPRKVP